MDAEFQEGRRKDAGAAMRYEANKINDSLWQVKRYHEQTTADDESDYDEAQVNVSTDDPQVAIDAAVRQGSWV